MDDIQSWWEVPSIAHFCSLFRAAFNLLDFDIEELEEALLTDGAEDAGSSLLQELIVRLLCGCLGNNDISTFNYQMFLRRLFRQKCQECGRDNPFNTDMDFQFLPLRTKVEILHALCDFRLDAEDVQDLLKNLESDSLRVVPLGHDENHSAYWYFYGTRLYKEDYTKIQKKKGKEKRRKSKEDKRRKKRGKSPPESDTEEFGSGTWQVICFTEHDWDKVTQVLRDSTSKAERALYRTLAEDFLPEIPRLFAEKERLQRKRLLDFQPRRQSSRLEKLKQQKVEEKVTREDEKSSSRLAHDESSKSSVSVSNKESRASRAQHRSASRTMSDCGSVESAVDSRTSAFKPVGRQTNNSLASATGQIVIQGLQRKLRSSQVFKQTEEDLQTGMYKILEHIKNHEDAWPFIDPVEEEYAPRYYSIVSKPMDLQRMEDKLDEGEYLSFNDFKTDFQLIVDNCRKYNGTENEYTEMVGNLEEAFQLAIDRYLESDPSSDEEIMVKFPLTTATAESQPPKGSRQQVIKSKEESIPDSVPSPATVPSPQSLYNVNQELKEKKFELPVDFKDSDESRTSTKDEVDSTARNKYIPPKKKKKKTEVIKNTAAIEALELATEQTLKDINKWLDDTPRFSEFSSASNSPSHFISGEEFEAVGTKIETEYRHRLKLERPPRSHNNKEPLKRRVNKDPLKVQRRREIQRTIERLQPGKSKGNLISNMQTLNAIKAKEEESRDSGKPKENRNTLVIKVDEATPKLSLGTVLTSDVLGFGVGQTSHNFDSETIQEKNVCQPEDEVSQTSPGKIQPSPEPQKVDTSPVRKKKKEEVSKTDSKKVAKVDSAMPNHSAWFKAFGAPKTPAAPKRKPELVSQEEPSYVEDRRIDPPSVSARTILDNSEVRSNVSEIKSPDDLESRFTQPRSQEPSSPHQQSVTRQRRISTGSSMSERSSFSQDLMDPMDSSSPRLILDERLGGYPSAPYPSPLHRSPMAASPVMASPRTEEPVKHPLYPPPNGTIRVGFYQDTSSSFQKASPEKVCSPREQIPPPPSYTPRMYPPTHDPGGFLPYQNQQTVAETPPVYDSIPNPTYGMMQYYDTSKPLTDQYQAARTQATTTSVATSYSNSVQKGFVQKSAPVIPVKKRMYTEMDSNSLQGQYNQPQQTTTLMTDRSAVGVLLNGMQPDSGSQMPPAHLKDRMHGSAMGYGQMPPINSVEMATSNQQLQPSGNINLHGSLEKPNQPMTQSMNLQQYPYTSMAMSHKESQHQTSVPQTSHHHQTVSSVGLADTPSRIQHHHMGYRGPFSPAPPSSLAMDPMRGNLANLSHIVDRYPTEESRILQSGPAYYDVMDKVMFGQGMPTTTQSSMSSTMFSQSPAAMTMAYNRDAPISYNRSVPELSSMSNKSPNIQSQYNRNISDSSSALPNKSNSALNMPTVYNRPEISTMMQNKSSSQVAYNRPVTDLSILPNRATPPVDIQSSYNPSPDLTTLLSTKGNPPPPYNRPQMTDYSILPSTKVPAPVDVQPPMKPARKRKSKQTVQSSEATGFQHYSSLKNTDQSPIALKTASVVPGSAFNFGPAPPALGLYGDKDGYSGFLEDYRTPPSGYYMHSSEASRDKVAQSSTSPFPFLSHPQPRPPSYPQLAQAFMNHHQPLMDTTGYQQYFQRHQEELMRHSSNPMVLHQSLLAPPTSYPPGYHPALGIRQTYDALNRPSWL